MYCDHCGHAAHNAKRFDFGPHHAFFGMGDPSHQHTTSLGISQSVPVNNQQNCGQQIKGAAPLPNNSIEIGSVDLCDTCQVVWMNRVRSLTQISEP